jgi:hypothetical protein
MSDVVFGKLESTGQLIAIDSETLRPVLKEGRPLNPVEYYDSIGKPVSKWNTFEKTNFVKLYGQAEFIKLHTGERAGQGGSKWNAKEKSEYIKTEGIESFKKLFR